MSHAGPENHREKNSTAATFYCSRGAMYTPMSSRLPLAILSLLAPGVLLAEGPSSDPISPDRPGLVNSPDTVGTRIVQLEMGGQSDRMFAGNRLRSTGSTPLSLRFGVSERLELRMETDGAIREEHARTQPRVVQAIGTQAIGTLLPFTTGPGWALRADPEEFRKLLWTGKGALPELYYNLAAGGVAPPATAGTPFSLNRRTFLRPGAPMASFELPALLSARIGTDPVETRLEGADHLEPKVSRGGADTSLGAKVKLLTGQGWLPSMGILAGIVIPNGSREFRGRGHVPWLNASVQWAPRENWSIGALIGGSYDFDDYGRRTGIGSVGVVVGFPIVGNLGGSLGLSAPQTAPDRAGGWVRQYEASLGYRITDDVQVDAAAYGAANRNAPRLTLTAGLSMRTQIGKPPVAHQAAP